MLTLLYRENAVRVELEAVERLCRYFNVPIGGLLELVDEPDAPDAISAAGSAELPD